MEYMQYYNAHAPLMSRVHDNVAKYWWKKELMKYLKRIGGRSFKSLVYRKVSVLPT